MPEVVVDVAGDAEPRVGARRQPVRHAHAAPQVRGDGAVRGHARRATGRSFGETAYTRVTKGRGRPLSRAGE
jgi:hypothetical protein